MTQSSNAAASGSGGSSSSEESSLNLVVRVQNTTTNTTIPSEPAARIMEFLERGLILELPLRSCAQGHNLFVEIRCDGLPAPTTFTSTAKVESVERSATSEQVVVQLLQFVEKEWTELQRSFSDRQEQILKFFQDAKGE